MSRMLNLAPFAITSGGALLVNVAKLTTAANLEAVVRAAAEDGRPVFVGVMLSTPEGELVLARLDNAADETAARMTGQRRRRERRRGARPSEKR